MTARLSLLLLSILVFLTLALPVAPMAVPTVFAAEPPVAALDDAPFGINTHLATRVTDPAAIDLPAELVAASGAGWAREDIHWWRVQPRPGVWDWTFTDAAFRALIERGVKIVGVLGHPAGWATPYSGDAPYDVSFYAPDQQQFVAYTRAVVQRYGAYVDHWEVWNEPDNPLFWKPTPDPAAYAALLGATSAAIHALDPDAKVLLGGINPFDTTYLRRVAESGVWDSFDILAIHPYVDPHSPEDGGIAASADAVRSLMDVYGQKPLWATEVGWSSGPGDHDRVGIVDQDMQADYLVRSMVLLWRAGIERSFWYALKDDPGNPYGLFALGTGRDDFTRPKPAYTALQTLSQQLRGASFVTMRDLFSRDAVLDFELFGRWTRGDQPYGTLTPSTASLHEGKIAAAINYAFPSAENDYVVFLRNKLAPIPGTPHELGIWVYGDGSAHVLKLWLRDAEGEVLQYSFGAVGAKGWHQLHAQLSTPVASWDRISDSGNGKLDFPASVSAMVLDDGPDSFSGRGTIYVDSLTAIGGPEAYDLRVRRGDTLVDMLWSPDNVQVRLPTASSTVEIVERDGRISKHDVQNGAVSSLALDDAPRYIVHVPFPSSRAP